VQVWLTSVNNEGHFSLEAEIVFHPYLASHFDRVTNFTTVILCPCATSSARFSKPVSKEGHFIWGRYVLSSAFSLPLK
jgi:hypothetical protein